MTTFKQKKAKAQKAARPSVVVEVSFDLGLAAERDALMADIAAAAEDARAGYDPMVDAQAKLDAINVQEQDSLVRVKVYRTKAREWAAIAANRGYLVAETAAEAITGNDQIVDGNGNILKGARAGDARIIDGKTEIEQTPEEWEEFFDLIAPSDFTQLVGKAYALNETEPMARVERLKKSSAGATGSNES